MIEITLFILFVGALIVGPIYLFGLTWISPLFIVGFLFALIIPGLYGAFTTGPFVPSNRKRIQNMIKLAALKKSDTVYDLGCGDGRLVFMVASKVKNAYGYDISIPLVLFGKIRAMLTFSKAKISWANLWEKKYGDATVIFCYLMPNAMRRFHKEVWPTLKKGTRVISNAFPMKELKPTKQEEGVYLYIR